VLLTLLTVLSPAIAQGPKKALREDQLLVLLSRGVYSSRVVMLVRERGITFAPTPDSLEKLRQAGADQALLDAVTNAGIRRTNQSSGVASSIPVKAHSPAEQRAVSLMHQALDTTGGVLQRDTALPATKITMKKRSKAQEYVSGAESELLEAYRDLVPSNSSRTIPPGTTINMRNWRNYKDFMPIGLQDLWKQKFFWRLPPETEIQVGPTHSYQLPKQYRQDTEIYSDRVSLVHNSRGGYDIQNYVAGAPFPNPGGPLAGIEILYNEYYAYIPYLITTYANLGFTMDRFKNKSTIEVREVNFKVKHLSDPGKPLNIPGLGDAFLTQNNIIWEPEQSKYLNNLQVLNDKPANSSEQYVFLPALRRSLRLSSSARCSPLVGSDYTVDDERSMNLQPPIFKARFLGYKKLLILANPLPAYVDKNARFGRPTAYYLPLFFPNPKAGAWEVRSVAVLDIRRVRSMSAGYCYGSRMAYIDKETWQPVWMDLYDRSLKLWKTGPSVYRPMSLPGTNGDVAVGAGGPGDGEYTFWDVQNMHLTFDIQTAAQINESAPKSYDDFARWGTPAGMVQVMQ
jgi:hypothetical protein